MNKVSSSVSNPTNSTSPTKPCPSFLNYITDLFYGKKETKTTDQLPLLSKCSLKQNSKPPIKTIETEEDIDKIVNQKLLMFKNKDGSTLIHEQHKPHFEKINYKFTLYNENGPYLIDKSTIHWINSATWAYYVEQKAKQEIDENSKIKELQTKIPAKVFDVKTQNNHVTITGLGDSTTEEMKHTLSLYPNQHVHVRRVVGLSQEDADIICDLMIEHHKSGYDFLYYANSGKDVEKIGNSFIRKNYNPDYLILIDTDETEKFSNRDVETTIVKIDKLISV